MIKLHEKRELVEFADGDAIISHFELSMLPENVLARIVAASDAGAPLHACIDPYGEEINSCTVLMLDETDDGLREACRERWADI